jgi:drug/metabolite transporter (DMT)-like permease
MQTAITSRRALADLSLLGVAFIWGLTFVMVRDAVHAYPVFAFLSARFILAFVAMIPLVLLLRKRAAGWGGDTHLGKQLGAGIILGLFLFAGFGFQTAGLQWTTPAKAGFITGLAVVLVPVLGVLFARERPRAAVWVGVGLATAGLALLSQVGVNLGDSINPGDVLVFFCALSFAGHIFITGKFAHRMNPLVLTTMQILTVAVLASITSYFFEPATPVFPRGQPLFAAAFTGLLATAAGFGIQTVAQRFTTATHTALILITEPLFAALASIMLIQESLGPGQWLGGILILVGMLAAELSSR